jgi:hypothetical protein
MSESKDKVKIEVSTGQGKSLLEQAAEITAYTPEQSNEIYKILDRLSMESGRLGGLGGKVQMTQAKIFRLEGEAKGVSAQRDPQKAAEQILEIGGMYKKMQGYQEEADQLRAEYQRIMALADAYNRPAPPRDDTLKLDGSQKTRQALQ